VYELVEACVQLPGIQELCLIGPCEEKDKSALLGIAGTRDNGDWLSFPGTLSNENVLEQLLGGPDPGSAELYGRFPHCDHGSNGNGMCGGLPQMLVQYLKYLQYQHTLHAGFASRQRTLKNSGKLSGTVRCPDKARIMGNRGREWILENYTLGNIAGKYRSVWGKSPFTGNMKIVIITGTAPPEPKCSRARSLDIANCLATENNEVWLISPNPSRPLELLMQSVNGDRIQSVNKELLSRKCQFIYLS